MAKLDSARLSVPILTTPSKHHQEAQQFVEYLFQLKNQDSGWIVNIRLDPYDNQLIGLFWMSPLQQQYLIQYLDIVQTDNTYKTNWFDMYLTLVVIIDNNTKTRLVAQLLSEDEPTKSYICSDVMSNGLITKVGRWTCQYFWNAYGEERGNKILNGEVDPPELPNNWQDNSERNTEPSGKDDMQSSITGDSRTSKTKKRKLEHSKIDTYLANLKIREAYAYLNPSLQLPDRHTFAGTTLNTVSDNIASYVVNQAKTSEYGVTVAFDGWTNVVNQCLIGSVLVTNNGEPLIWDIVDVSGHRERTKEIMEYTVALDITIYYDVDLNLDPLYQDFT
ncbi:hypothetical protein C2G38_2168662 [Gigaspora rosea]|uniref:DUF659 domain-containing protein n=1 Tax=Gigaspora rosea TaxID=44941 RepID=A0A397VTS9_9GLOM|nr:hypothetical protein C2G38_2168662 [Gigaspora rosea]